MPAPLSYVLRWHAPPGNFPPQVGDPRKYQRRADRNRSSDTRARTSHRPAADPLRSPPQQDYLRTAPAPCSMSPQTVDGRPDSALECGNSPPAPLAPPAWLPHDADSRLLAPPDGIRGGQTCSAISRNAAFAKATGPLAQPPQSPPPPQSKSLASCSMLPSS